VKQRGLPAGEARAAWVGLALLLAAAWWSGVEPGPGPLALLTGVAAFHAAVLTPSCRPRGGVGWAFLPLLLAAPVLATVSYGHPGMGPLLRCALLVALACLAATTARTKSGGALYLPTMLGLFVVPFVLGYLVLEFSGPATADDWRRLSPFAAAKPLASGEGWPWACLLLLLAWPVWTLARRGK
jgi:hypothetical protein